ncbi:hypothetical protein ACFYMW_00430 [Streptomyces sp. NPDC006692]|uniref:hypothetical protein n=1 Tax=Streptomyces sp. NPDC006692 TaxID=3364758 RepID=UPI0036AC4462
MFRRRARAEREFREAQREALALMHMHALHEPQAFDTAQAEVPKPSSSGRGTEAPDLLPPDFRAPARQDVAGLMMRWDQPLVIDGEVRECPQCGAYRNWIVFNMRDDSIWLRCKSGHETKETGLDTAWYNRNSGPVDHFHSTLEDGLRHLGH